MPYLWTEIVELAVFVWMHLGVCVLVYLFVGLLIAAELKRGDVLDVKQGRQATEVVGAGMCAVAVFAWLPLFSLLFAFGVVYGLGALACWLGEKMARPKPIQAQPTQEESGFAEVAPKPMYDYIRETEEALKEEDENEG